MVLSACESGLSRVRRGDELVGFIRAFTYAGAAACVATLWRVDERSTRILMERFYRELGAGLPAGEALTQAQLYLRRLTDTEVTAIIERLPQHAGGADGPYGPAGHPGQGPAIPRADMAHAFLKGSGNPAPTDDERPDENQAGARPFADPSYWAPFVLIGDPGLILPQEAA